MKYITLVGAAMAIVNMVIHYNNDAAFWGWLAAAAWASCLFIHELVRDKY